MKNLNRNHNQASPDQIKAYKLGQLQQKVESYEKERSQLWNQFEEIESQKDAIQRDLEESYSMALQEREKEQRAATTLDERCRVARLYAGSLGQHDGSAQSSLAAG